MPFGIGVQELIWIVIIVLILFGGRKIPEVMRGLGQGLQEFRKASSQVQEEFSKATLPEPGPDTDQPQKPA